MKILVTGADGFVGKNLIAELNNRGYSDIVMYNRNTDIQLLNEYTKQCEFVFHLAGVNRPKDDKEFMEGNFELTTDLLQLLKKHNNKSPVLYTSSIQAERDNPYGRSKKAGEEILTLYGLETGAKVILYRLPNLFGKWSRPHYNSVVATFCYNISRDIDVDIHDPNALLQLSYIDDVIAEFIMSMDGKESNNGDFCYIPVTYSVTVGQLADKLYGFRNNRNTLVMPSLESQFDKALYGTYLSYLDQDDFSYKLNKIEDNRGWLAEFIKSDSMGQIFVSKTKPGITRGNHWHHTKVEKFLVIQGEAVVKFKMIGKDHIIEYKVRGELPEVVDIPAGYAHSITNTGTGELITLFWACEIFNFDEPDTYFLEV